MKFGAFRAIVYVLFFVFFLTAAAFLSPYQASVAGEPQTAQGKPLSAELTGKPASFIPSEAITPPIESLPTVSAAAPVVSVMRYELDCFDLESGTVISTDDLFAEAGGACPEHGDFRIAYNADRTPHAVLFQNECADDQCRNGVETAVVDAPFDNVALQDAESLVRSRDLIDTPFSNVTVFVTAEGNYYKVELVEEGVACDAGHCVSFRWQALPSN